MSAIFQCPLCGKKIVSALTCNQCRCKYDLNEPWAKQLLRDEKDTRNGELRDKRHGLRCLSDVEINMEGETYDGWDALDGEVGRGAGKPWIVNVLEPSMEEQELALVDLWWDELATLDRWITRANLTQGEINVITVLCAFNWHVSSVEAANLLSQLEGKNIKATAFRRRLTDARRKLRSLLSRKLRAS